MKNILILFVLLSMNPLVAQDMDGRYTEAEIAIHDKYIEAKKYVLIGRFEKAQKILTALYIDNRSNAAIATELSKVYGFLEDPYNEHKFAEKAYKNDPKNELVLANFAYVSLQQEKLDEVLPLLESLIEMNPSNEEYTDKLAIIYIQSNQPERAIKIYNKLENIIGVTENVSRRKYEIYVEMNKKKKAIQELENLSGAFPYNITYLHNLASYNSKLGNTQKALDIYKHILTIDINDTNANMAIATSNTETKSGNNYLRSLATVIENKSISVDRKILELIPYLDKLNTVYDTELADVLLMLSDKISIIHPDNAKSHALKGDIFMAAGRAKDAAKSYLKTIELNDNVYPVWEGLMEAYTEILDIHQLKKIAIRTLDYFPNKPSAYMYYGRAFTLNNEVEEAIEILNEGVLVSGKDLYGKSNIYAELGRAYFANGKTEKATQSIEKALIISGNKNSLAFEILGDILFQKGNRKEALENWKKAKSMGMHLPSLQQKIEQKKL